MWWGRNKRHDIVVEPRLVQSIHTFGETAAHIQVLNYASADDALGSGRKNGCSGQSRLLGGGGLACDRWRGACLEDAVFPAVQAAAPRPRREGPRPLQAAARRRLELTGVLGGGFTLGCCGGGCAVTFSSSLSSSLESPAAFSHHEALIGRIFPSGRAQPSSLLVSGMRGMSLCYSLRPPRRLFVASRLRAPPTKFPRKNSAPEGTRQ